ncbi:MULTISPECIES: YkyB family protein [Bhargavaea]|uniref:YkyB family protein n=1 Tax=Bhargavaea changchunensis TaxID=2134037 RepID=A0ABW2NCH1_9BACL|nr:YkyB family protein [Bhargavaea sp. CC-171006]
MANSLNNREQLAGAIYIINKHAKTAPDNEFLYKLKKASLEKMMEEGLAEKIGLQSIANPKFSRRQSAVLITCGEFHFHLPPNRDEMKTLPHLGEPDPDYRNPKVRLGLKAAKQILQDYTGLAPGVSGRSFPEGQSRSASARPMPAKHEQKANPPAGGRRNQKPSPSRHRSWFDQ